jgi:hypothetical protein
MVSALGLLAQVNPVSDLLDAVTYFSDAATVDPVSGLLFVLGQLLFVVSFALFGYMVLGGIVDYVIPDSPGRAPPQQE